MIQGSKFAKHRLVPARVDRRSSSWERMAATESENRPQNNYFTEMCSGSEAGSYFRRINFVYFRRINFVSLNSGLRVTQKKRTNTG